MHRNTLPLALVLGWAAFSPLTSQAQDPSAAPSSSLVADPTAALTPAATPPPTVEAPAPIPTSQRAGRVVRQDGRDVIIDLGSEDGIQIGMRMEASEEVEVSLDGVSTETQHRSVAVGQVMSVTAHRAQVTFGVNEVLPVGTELRPTTSPMTASAVAPRRVGGVLEVAGTLSPILVLGDIGAGAMAEASVTYRGVSAFFVRATLGPIGFATVSQGSMGFGSGALVGGFDSRFLELGLGVGLVNYHEDSSCTPGSSCGEVTLRPGIALSSRLGALDGLHMRFASTLALTPGEFRVGTLDAALQVPLVTGVWLLARGGAGVEEVGYAYAGAAVRWLARGNGGAGSLFLTGGLEWTRTRVPPTDIYDYEGEVSGIAPTLGVEYRR